MNHYPNPIWHRGFHWGIVVPSKVLTSCLQWCDHQEWRHNRDFVYMLHSHDNTQQYMEIVFATHEQAMEFALTWT